MPENGDVSAGVVAEAPNTASADSVDPCGSEGAANVDGAATAECSDEDDAADTDNSGVAASSFRRAAP
jgi:hypothetical protein